VLLWWQFWHPDSVGFLFFVFLSLLCSCLRALPICVIVLPASARFVTRLSSIGAVESDSRATSGQAAAATILPASSHRTRIPTATASISHDGVGCGRHCARRGGSGAPPRRDAGDAGAEGGDGEENEDERSSVNATRSRRRCRCVSPAVCRAAVTSAARCCIRCHSCPGHCWAKPTQSAADQSTRSRCSCHRCHRCRPPRPTRSCSPSASPCQRAAREGRG